MRVADASYVLARLLRNGIRRRPLNASTEVRITRLCTQRCRQCSVYERTTHPPTLSFDRFRTIARKLREYGAFIGFISGGEPTLVPHLDRILMEAKKTFRLATTLVTGLVNDTRAVRRAARTALDHDIHIQTSLDGLGAVGDDLRGVRRFSDTVLRHMEWIADHRGGSGSLLYANIVLNQKNLHQVPELVRTANDAGWKTTVGLYHSITKTTRADAELRVVPGPRLDELIRHLRNHPGILNLDAFLSGIPRFVEGGRSDGCAFVDAPVLATRTTVMENGDVHLCWGDPIGNLLDEDLQDIFGGGDYHRRIDGYRGCRGCWTTCYTQRYLLVRPRSPKQLLHNIKKVRTLHRRN